MPADWSLHSIERNGETVKGTLSFVNYTQPFKLLFVISYSLLLLFH